MAKDVIKYQWDEEKKTVVLTMKKGTLHLDKIMESGQVFSWDKIDDMHYLIDCRDGRVEVSQAGDKVYFSCGMEEFEKVWYGYFDLDYEYGCDLEGVVEGVGADYLRDAIEFGSGIRILRQDFWEMVFTFVITQNNSMVKTKKTLKILKERFGKFPEPEDVLNEGEEILENAMLGYRLPYIISIAKAFAENKKIYSYNYMRKLDYSESMEKLMLIKGIGPKVANCICLYGLGIKNAFPRDTWIKKIEKEYFDGHFEDEKYPENAGIMQQYIFFYERLR